ncbi:unnamed protein product [Ixodes pacificus]
MGQQASSEFAGNFFRQTQTLRELTTITYDGFLAKVRELNEMQSLTDSRNRSLVFEVRAPTETPVLWKKEVRVCCRRVKSMRLMSLRQFLQAYHTIKAYHSAAMDSSATSTAGTKTKGGPPPKNLCTSALFNGVLDVPESDLEECCVCMERKPEVTLPCTHSYCLFCIEQWNVSNTTCPLCREEFDITDDTWVISEAPESEEVLNEMQKALVEISTRHSGGEGCST